MQRLVSDDVSAVSQRFDAFVTTFNHCTSSNIDSSLDEQLLNYVQAFSKLQGTLQDVYLRGDHKTLRDEFASYEAYTQPFVSQAMVIVDQLMAESSVSRRRIQLSELGQLLADQRSRHNAFVDAVNTFEQRRF